ncbi:hypothetical protein [Leucobacter chromiireducens]|uniref:Bacteriocin biosynthesis cyclodehydratase domain-containing protein n=1 Tax=Leucobacter chromiireducens subsp. solipictus TaxID=398235 RepID=A0ABS1SBV5_9MICO|nr:hypothetical protein [Leucobacter chromiireducens]MBL3678023.1 hypothetical protein [Leucobacter chromiireducens subsp. solipictus]
MTLLRIRRDLPLGWEDPDTLRLGFERAVARIRDPSPGQQRLLGRFRTGVRSEDLPGQTRAAGATPREARALLAAIAPALAPGIDPAPGPAAVPRPRVFLSDDARPVPGLAPALTAAGTCVEADSVGSCDVVLHVERFLEPLERAQRWLRADLPHLLLRFSDTRLSVGPLVIPPGRPCHTCASLQAIERDPGLPVLAAQLIGARPASETSLVGAVAGVAAATAIEAWRTAGVSEPATAPSADLGERLVYPIARGRVAGPPRSVPVSPHPECACGALG